MAAILDSILDSSSWAFQCPNSLAILSTTDLNKHYDITHCVLVKCAYPQKGSFIRRIWFSYKISVFDLEMTFTLILDGTYLYAKIKACSKQVTFHKRDFKYQTKTSAYLQIAFSVISYWVAAILDAILNFSACTRHSQNSLAILNTITLDKHFDI